MAVAPAPVPVAPAATHRPPAVRHFVRLKLRILGNGMRGRASRKWLFGLGIAAGVYAGGLGALLFGTSVAGGAQVRLMAASFGGAAIVVGSALLPLIWFGVDDSLDPARFALLPVPRGRMVAGHFAAALVSVPAAALLVATAGLLVPAAGHGGLGAAAAQAAGVVAGLLLCVALARAVTSAFATMLRSRRVRDLAGVMLACLAALLGPTQLMITSAVEDADWDRLARVAEVIGWTPLSAAHTIGYEVGAGRPVAALAKLLITVAAVVGLLWWWSRNLESAMLGASGASAPRQGTAPEGPVEQLYPRLLRRLPTTASGAIVARELRYWWRDAKRRSNVITIAVIGVLMPVILSVTGGRGGIINPDSPVLMSLAPLFVGAFAASVLANQFGFDGSSYATHLTVGVPGQVELRARALAYSVVIVPMLLLVGVVLAVVSGDALVAPAAWGALLAGYGVGLVVNTYLSVLAAYALPEGSNPFAISSGSGVGKSLLALLGLVATYAACTPLVVAAVLFGDSGLWPWLALPVGAGYGAVAAWLGTYLAGDVLDHRTPELLSAVTPNR